VAHAPLLVVDFRGNGGWNLRAGGRPVRTRGIHHWERFGCQNERADVGLALVRSVVDVSRNVFSCLWRWMSEMELAGSTRPATVIRRQWLHLQQNEYL